MTFVEKLIKLLETPAREFRIYNNSPTSPFQVIFDTNIGTKYNIYNITIVNHLSGEEITFSERIHLINPEKDLSNFIDVIAKEIENENI